MDVKEKTEENLYRRKLLRMGYRLKKSRRKDPNAYDYGGYMILDVWTGGVVAGNWPNQYSFTYQDVKRFVDEQEPNVPPVKRGRPPGSKAKKRRKR